MREHGFENCAIELKLCKGKSLPFKSVAEHQVQALQQVKNGGLYHKISDIPTSWVAGDMRYTAKKPFDCLYIKGAAYVAICFYIPRTQKVVYGIDIDDFVALTCSSGRKSITEDMATQAASFTLRL